MRTSIVIFYILWPVLINSDYKIDHPLLKHYRRYKREMSCVEECEWVKENEICWNQNDGVDGPYYFAYPHCLDASNYPTRRYCINGEFEPPESKCEDFQRNITYCEENYKEEENQGCYRILNKSSHDESNCPYKNFRYFDNLNDVTSYTWFPARRSGNLGEFVVYEASLRFGEIISPDEYDVPIKDADCLVYHNGRYKAVSCDDQYRRVCGYKYLHEMKDYCSRAYFGRGIEGHFNKSKQTCLFIEDKNITPLEKNELQFPYQSKSIIELIGSKACAFNTINFMDCSYPCENNIRDYYNYTFWSYTTQNFDEPWFIHLTQLGWHLSHIKPLNLHCLIKEENYYIPPPSISISIQQDNRIQVRLTEQSFAFFENKLFVYFCFTTAEPLHIYGIFSPGLVIQYTGYYWCEAFHVITYEIIKTNTLLVKKDDVFVVEFWMIYINGEDPTSTKFMSKKFKHFEENLETSYNFFLNWIKTLEVLEDIKWAKYLIHIHSPSNQPEYFIKRTIIEDFFNRSEISLNVSKVYTSQYCMEEKTMSNNRELIWETTEAGSAVSPDKTCIDKNGIPVTRLCHYTFYYGARWVNFSECYGMHEEYSEHTDLLYGLLQSNASTKNLTQELCNMTKKADEYVAVDIHFVASIMEKFEVAEVELVVLSNILSNLMNGQKEIMSASQEKTNATDRILDRFDVILKEQSGEEFITTDNLFLFNFQVNSTSTGLGLIKNGDSYESVQLNNTDFASIENLEIAAVIPQTILDEINDTALMTIYLFVKNSYFNDHENGGNVRDENIGILLPLGIEDQYEIPIYFRSTKQQKCVFWNYGLNKSGSWEIDHEAELSKDFNVCTFSHTTHFGLLVSNKKIENDNVLNIITAVCCALSLFGTLGIITTAVLFKTWRQNQGNIILLNYSIVTLLQICFLYLSDNILISHDTCILIGVCLQFSVLSQFCWMLVFGFLQYKRYVRVFFGVQNWLLPKAFIFSYLTPTIPVIILLVLFQDTFTKGNGSLCYPTGNSLIYGVLMPISIIIGANLVVLVKITMELFCCKRTKCIDDDIFMLRLRLLFLMFFMLGVTWCFGLLAQIFDSLICIYIFTTTASLQGFVLFVFFIVMNKNARIMYAYMWRKHRLCY